jgi:hypothetical protein
MIFIQASWGQQRAWQDIVASQDIDVTALDVGSDPGIVLRDWLAQGRSLPQLLLLEWDISTVTLPYPNSQVDVDLEPISDPGVKLRALCQQCEQLTPPVQVVGLLHESLDGVALVQQREQAIALGAADLLPPIEGDNPIAAAIAGVRRILSLLGDRPLQQDPLVTTLTALKRDVINHTHSHAAPPPSPPPNPTSNNAKPAPPPSDSPKSPPSNRRYRGRSY